MKTLKIRVIITALFCLFIALSSFGKNNPESLPAAQQDNINPRPLVEESVVCSVGAIHNFISNSTHTQATGTQEWTILIGDDSAENPSMLWTVPAEYSDNNQYLYFSSLRIGYNGHQIHLSNDTSPGIDVVEPPLSISDFDTHFMISDQSDSVPDDYRVGVRVHQNTYAWDESDADDFIIYEYWIVNISGDTLDPVYVALHVDCDISTAEGGSGDQQWSIDDLVDYYADFETGEFISYMYDADNPNRPGNDEGGHQTPKESAGYVGSRLLYCPPVVGDITPSVQSGHGYWDWNSDPSEVGGFADWYDRMSDGSWRSLPPSPFDYRFFQKTGPFEIADGDSIKVVFAFGIGNGLQGMRSNLRNAYMLFENDYAYYNLPPETPHDFTANVLDNDIEFTWAPCTDDDLSGYNLYFSTDPEGPFERINGAPINTCYYLYSPTLRDQFYFYIKSEDSGGEESIASEILAVSTLPNPPSNFRAVPGNNSVHLSWEIQEGVDSYKIYRDNNSGEPYSLIGEITDPSNNNYTDNDVNNYQTYYYVATSVQSGYESDYSGEIEVTPNPNSNGRVLLVDDYCETDENTGEMLKYQDRRRFWQRWGIYNFDYDIWSIIDQGMIDSSEILNYSTVVWYSGDGKDGTWQYDIGNNNGGVLRYFLENGGRLLASGSLILPYMFNNNPPLPGDFEYDWFGIDSVQSSYDDQAWDYAWWLTWVIGAEPGYPDSMIIDIAIQNNQDDYATAIYSLRPGADTLFTWGLWVDGSPPGEGYYQQPIGIIYRPDGNAVTSLLSFVPWLFPGEDIKLTVGNILYDEFGCTFYENPSPLPPWQVYVNSMVGNRLRLIWDAPDEDDISTIRIYRSIFDGPFELLNEMSSNIREYIDEDVNLAVEYNYKLAFIDFTGQVGEFTQTLTEIGGRPQTPINVQTQAGDAIVNISWEYPDDPAINGYKIYRCQGEPGVFELLATLPQNEFEYTDTDVINRQEYYYYLVSTTDYGVDSYPSETVFAFPYSLEDRSGILVVNGVCWSSYGQEIISFYQDEVPTGDTNYYHIWDLFYNTPLDELPHPEFVQGNGDLPVTCFADYSLIIWVGNGYNGDLELWYANESNIINYLNSGGNMLLLCRYGSRFFFDELREYAHVTEFLEEISITSLIAQQEWLTDIDGSGLSYTGLVHLDSSYNYNDILYTAIDYPDWIAGFATTGESGKFVHIAGRPYRMNHDDLKANCDTIITHYFKEHLIIETSTALPQKFVLHQNYPNPFNPNTIIQFDLPVKAVVNLKIYDILGRQVKVLVDKEMETGYHEVIWDGKTASGENSSSGVYFYKLDTGEFESIKKMVLLK